MLFLLAAVPEALGQGLVQDPKATLGAPGALQALSRLYKDSKAWRKVYKYSRARACSKQSGSLCSSAYGSQQDAQLLLMATSPQAYDSRKAAVHTVVGPVKDQGLCSSCMAFAVLAAAESAMAVALQQSASGALSEQDFYFCKGARPGFQSSCDEAWTLVGGVENFIKLHDSKQYITTTKCMSYNPFRSDVCSAGCTEVLPALKSGSFKGTTLNSLARMQDYIRRYGSIVCRIDIYSDLRSFFQSHRAGVYRGPGTEFQL